VYLVQSEVICLVAVGKTKSDCDSVTDVCCGFVRLNAGGEYIYICMYVCMYVYGELLCQVTSPVGKKTC
jgi:hypothetical protein